MPIGLKMGSLKLKFVVLSVCGLVAWGYFKLSAPSSPSDESTEALTSSEQKTVQNFAQFLEKNPNVVKNHSGENSSDSHTGSPQEMDAETFQKVSHQVNAGTYASDEDKAFKLISGNPSKDKIITLTRLLKNDENHLGVSADEKGLAINHLRNLLETDPGLVHDFIEAASTLGNDPELKSMQSIYVREVARFVKAGSPDAPQFMALFQSQNLPDFDPTVREVSNQFPEVREQALRRMQTRSIASEPEASEPVEAPEYQEQETDN